MFIFGFTSLGNGKIASVRSSLSSLSTQDTMKSLFLSTIFSTSPGENWQKDYRLFSSEFSSFEFFFLFLLILQFLLLLLPHRQKFCEIVVEFSFENLFTGSRSAWLLQYKTKIVATNLSSSSFENSASIASTFLISEALYMWFSASPCACRMIRKKSKTNHRCHSTSHQPADSSLNCNFDESTLEMFFFEKIYESSKQADHLLDEDGKSY